MQEKAMRNDKMDGEKKKKLNQDNTQFQAAGWEVSSQLYWIQPILKNGRRHSKATMVQINN